MDTNQQRYIQNRVYVWDTKFETRQQESYHMDQTQIGRQQSSPESIVESFLRQRRFDLEPPENVCVALRQFLEQANEDDLQRDPSVGEVENARLLALIDERCDRTGWKDYRSKLVYTRDWPQYARYPPTGECQQREMLNARGLYQRLGIPNRSEVGAERRTVYIENISSLCALAVASTTPVLQTAELRDFLHRIVIGSHFIGVSMPSYSFALEFHLPYYALRTARAPLPDSRGLRRHGRFILADSSHHTAKEYLYESQISLLIIGIDEWFWTAYLCLDTFFEGKENISSHYSNDNDALIGGAVRPNKFPVWNPRQYFLFILSRRFKQVTKEWAAIVRNLEGRLHLHEEGIFGRPGEAQEALEDDRLFSRTRKYTEITRELRLLYNGIIRTIVSWEEFESGELQYFQTEELLRTRSNWGKYLADIDIDLKELRALRRILQQRIEFFDSMRNGLVNASAMVESRVATDQGDNIGRLTRVTVAYLPLSLGTV